MPEARDSSDSFQGLVFWGRRARLPLASSHRSELGVLRLKVCGSPQDPVYLCTVFAYVDVLFMLSVGL